jgi:hypothetical protein
MREQWGALPSSTLCGAIGERIQREDSPGTAWTYRRGRRENQRMPLELTNAELATAAQACRAMAYQEGERAKKMENPTTRGPIEAAAQRYEKLAQKFESARKKA